MSLLLLREQCGSCVFRPGNPMHLRPGRLRDLVAENHRRGTALICHETLSFGDHPEVGEALCRGFYDRYGPEINYIRVIERLGGFAEVSIPPEVPSTADVVGVIGRVGSIPPPSED